MQLEVKFFASYIIVRNPVCIYCRRFVWIESATLQLLEEIQVRAFVPSPGKGGRKERFHGLQQICNASSVKH
jgi:hypothetical protein